MAVASSLRNRANARDRPKDSTTLRQSPIVPVESQAKNRCKEGVGHNHVFQYGDRYGCCTVCGDEVLT